MKKLFTLLFATLCGISSIYATDYTIFPDADVPSYALPISYFHQSSYYGSISQQIYWAEELTDQGASAGDINSITFYYTAAKGTTAAAFSRSIEIWLMEVANTTDVYSIETVPWSTAYSSGTDYLSAFLHNGTTKKAGVKVFDGSLATESVTSSNPINFTTDIKSVTLPISSFSWDGSKNIVMTVIDKTNTNQSSANLRFLIASTKVSSTSYPRFTYTRWLVEDDEHLGWISDFSGAKYGDHYPFSPSSAQKSDQAGQRSYVNKVTFSIVTPIPAPANLAASSITTSSATLSWDAAAGATGYNVRWGKTSGSLDHSQNNVAATSLAISDLDDGETYYFDVQTITAGGTSAWASEASFNTTAITHIHDGITFSKWASTTAMPTSGNYYLANDVTYDFYEGGYLDLAGDLNLCLNGHTISLGTKSINVANGHTMTLYDNEGGGKITGFVAGNDGSMTFKGVISVENGGTLVLREGEVENTFPADDPEYKSIAVASGGTLIVSGAPIISGNDIDIFLAPSVPAKVITIESGKPLTNSTPYKVYKASGVLTSGWAYMSGADPMDHFVSANPDKSVYYNGTEAALRTLLNLSESSLNSSISTSYNQVADVNLTRSLTSSQYNTFCLPFALSNAQLEDIFGAGYDLEEFVSAELEGDELTLTFSKVTALEAGKPYLIQPSVNVTNPSFEGVTITATSPVDQTSDTYISFHGTFKPTELEGGNHNLLFLGEDNTLYWPEATGNLKGFRAYFEVKGSAQLVAKRARIVKEGDAPTDIENQKSEIKNQKYIKDGHLFILRDGKTYNILGQKD